MANIQASSHAVRQRQRQRRHRDSQNPPPVLDVSKTLVSAILLTYNQQDYIQEAIAIAVAQTYQPLEIIVSDDCSTDDTFEVAKRFLSSYRGPHRVHLRRNDQNLGIARHFDLLMSMAQGRLIVGFAGDDISYPERVAKIVRRWKSAQGAISAVHSRVMTIDPRGKPLGMNQPLQRLIDDCTPTSIAESGHTILGATAAWDKRIQELFGQLPAACVVEDSALLMRAALIGKVAYIEEPLVLRRAGGISCRESSDPAYDYLFGLRIKEFSWHVGNANAFIQDFKRFPHLLSEPERLRLATMLMRRVQRMDFSVTLARSGVALRIGHTLRAPWLSLLHRDLHYVNEAVKYLFHPLYGPFLNRKLQRLQARKVA